MGGGAAPWHIPTHMRLSPPHTCVRLQVIKLSKELPVVVEYRVADFGYVRYYLAPKVRGDGGPVGWFSIAVLQPCCGAVAAGRRWLGVGVRRCRLCPTT